MNCENTAAIMINGEAYAFYSLKIDLNNTLEFFCVPGEPGSRIEITKREVKGWSMKAKKIDEGDPVRPGQVERIGAGVRDARHRSELQRLVLVGRRCSCSTHAPQITRGDLLPGNATWSGYQAPVMTRL
ncbi:MAG: hypothetical protein R3E64_04020 [Halioglobus sp.]